MTSSLFFCRSSLLDPLESFGKRVVFLDVDSHFMTQIVIMIQISSQEKVVVLGSPFQVKCCFSNFSISVFFFQGGHFHAVGNLDNWLFWANSK